MKFGFDSVGQKYYHWRFTCVGASGHFRVLECEIPGCVPDSVSYIIMVDSMIVDSLKLAREQQRVAGRFAVAQLPRLVESLLGNTGDLDYVIAGDKDTHERPLLRLQVSGVVQLQCQRCLEGFAQHVDIDTALRLVAEAALDAEYEACGDDPSEPECIAASSELDVAALIEDEVLLALPPYPRHEAGVCESKLVGANVASKVASQSVTAFSALQALKVN